MVEEFEAFPRYSSYGKFFKESKTGITVLNCRWHVTFSTLQVELAQEGEFIMSSTGD